MDTSTGKLTDLGFLGNFTGNNPERMRKYILIFLEITPVEERSLHEHLAAKNWEGIRAAAHSMRPQLTYMGIKTGGELLSMIEKNCETLSGLEELPTHIDEFHKIFTSACEELNAYIKTTNP